MARNKSMSSKGRREDTREEKHAKIIDIDNDSFLSISFRYFNDLDKDGQSIETWRQQNLIDRLFTSIHYVTTNNFTQLSTSKVLENYRKFPENEKTKFTCPSTLSKNLNWGVIRSVGGAERIAGFIKDKVFYVVFLDMNHHFYLTKKDR